MLKLCANCVMTETTINVGPSTNVISRDDFWVVKLRSIGLIYVNDGYPDTRKKKQLFNIVGLHRHNCKILRMLCDNL